MYSGSMSNLRNKQVYTVYKWQTLQTRSILQINPLDFILKSINMQVNDAIIATSPNNRSSSAVVEQQHLDQGEKDKQTLYIKARLFKGI